MGPALTPSDRRPGGALGQANRDRKGLWLGFAARAEERGARGPRRLFAGSARRDRRVRAGEEEKVGGGDGIAQELDALANEWRDSEDFFRRGMEAGLLEEGLEEGASSSTGRARMCSALRWTALGSNGVSRSHLLEKLTTALARLTPSRVKAPASSSSVRNSRSFLGDQPSRQRKLMKAWGRKPASR